MIELLIVIGVIAWAISSSSSRKKRREREARAARTAFAPAAVSISSVTAVFGAPVVIYMMIRRKAGRI